VTSFALGTAFGHARTPSYLDGRILRAEDLTGDQASARAQARLLGRAVGAGVIDGLTVRAAGTSLTVLPGGGVAPSGDGISLEAEITLPLALPLSPATTTAPQDVFRCCDSSEVGGTTTTVRAGRYVLSVRGTSRSEDQKCAAGWTVGGLEFRATTLEVPEDVLGIAVTVANGRSLVAHWCLGAVAMAELPQDVFGAGLTASPLALLGADELALAVFAWDGRKVSDVDAWSARRRITLPEPNPSRPGVLGGDARIAGGQARFYQFTEQVEELAATGAAAQAEAYRDFGLLPPAGFLPVTAASLRKDATNGALANGVSDAAGSGFHLGPFFGDQAVYGGLLDWDLVEFLLRDSWHRMPVPVEPTGTQEQPGEPVRRTFTERISRARLISPAVLATLAGPGGLGEEALAGSTRLNAGLEALMAARAAGQAAAGQEPAGQEPAGAVVGQKENTSHRFTWYLVPENLVRALATAGLRRANLERAASPGAPSGLYAFFVANWRWFATTKPPLVLAESII